MKKLFALTGIALSASCISTTAGEYKPTFELDYSKCGSDPVISSNSVTFGTGNTCSAGRVVSQKRYKNITKVTATIDLSRLTQNWVNAAFYLVENRKFPDKQPIKENYCDAGGNHDDWNCREIDFLETNGNKIFQTTMHLDDGGAKAPQRYEYSFTAAADNSCFDFINMSGDPMNGTHDLAHANVLDVSKPFEIITEFTDQPGMKTDLRQPPSPVVWTIYDTKPLQQGGDNGAEGSNLFKYGDLTTSRNNGQWILVSFWQGNWAPQGPGNRWWKGSCPWGKLCNSDGQYWGISNIVVTAESEL